MKNQTEYRLVLSDKSKVVIVAANAGEAIELRSGKTATAKFWNAILG